MGASWRHAETNDGPAAGFAHEAFTYTDDPTYIEGTVPFVLGGLTAGEQVMVAVPAARLELLRAHLPAEAAGLRFERMDDLGRNPAWIIPAWADFAAAGDGRGVRVLAEPIWSARSVAEIVECERHEALVNVAFAQAAAFVLRCAYDAATLTPAVLAAAHGSHPVIGPAGRLEPSSAFDGAGPDLLPRSTLPPVPPSAPALEFDRTTLGLVRRLVEREASESFLPAPRAHDIALAAHEAAANSVVHGRGGGSVSTWTTGERFVCEVVGEGTLVDLLAGRVRPTGEHQDGRGLWLIHQLCDLVQLRASGDGLCVRMHMGAQERVRAAPVLGPPS